MPTPLEVLLDPVSQIVLAIFFLLMLWEALFPGRQLPKIKGWKLRGLVSFVIYFYLSTYLPLFIDPYLSPYQLFDLSKLGTAGGVVVAVLVYELVGYTYHRAMHTFNPLWRAMHQMHHSAERIDTFGAFFFSPLDMIGWTLVGTVSFTLLAGFSPQAITITLLTIIFLGVFQHSNIKTPHWLGYILQRPESHTYHHGRGIHKFNYADLPVIDMLLGTFYNPETFENETGFYDGASSRIPEMLAFKDVSKPE